MSAAKDVFLAMKPEVRSVPLPGGAAAFVRQMTVGERLKLQEAMQAHGDRATHSLVLVFCLSDEAGAPLFSLDELDKLDALPGPIADALVTAAGQLNALGVSAVDDAAKN